MATFHFELVSPDKQMFSGEAESVLVPGNEGDFVVLKDHAAVMTALRPGVIAVEDAAGHHRRIFVRMNELHERDEKIDRVTVACGRRSSTACASSRTR